MSEKTQQVNSQEDDFTSTKGSGESWNPKANKDKVPYAPAERTFDATVQPDHKTKDILIGYFVDKREGVGQHLSTVHTFIVKDEQGQYTKKVDVWGDTVLNKEIEKVPAMNILVKLEWLGQGVKKGMKEGQKGAGFNKWDVGYKADNVLPGANADKNVASEVKVSETPPVQESKATEKSVVVNANDDTSDLPF